MSHETLIQDKTVDSYIGKLRSIFHDFGRDGEWDLRLCLGNPAADRSIKEYLRVFTMEQLKARVQPKQASPFLIGNLDCLTSHIEDQMKLPNLSTTQRFVMAQDQAYFKAVFFSGDRPGDMGQVKVPEILRFPNNNGFLFNHTWGKTLGDGSSIVFGIRRNPQTNICLVRGIEQYITIAEQLKIDLRQGYLFRPTNPQGAIINAPFTLSTAEARLKKNMGCDHGATLHGFRAGCTITLALSGVELSDVMDHVGWTQRHTAVYYLQLAKVLNPGGASSLLTQADLTSVTQEWENANDLRRFISAFPSAPLQKRPNDTC
ncbi:LIGHT-DEPENDENT SHORT HYPOCOTYLS 6 [Paramuricea clavata]|uniref:LIGHT-DEPENDENT SHORT HYPOCOTYLS 6 n=1 Tax=Paramuricea clavata TaxID=317549 RepID=A0A6S7GTY4_PARCT|nr:LIGHT-DEPENDENT SHORT HYPOCOTYLS 6 [Paramuricea clavata]